jgi:hypothetical protein
MELLLKKKYKRCPIMIGTNGDEGFMFDGNPSAMSTAEYGAFMDVISAALAPLAGQSPAEFKAAGSRLYSASDCPGPPGAVQRPSGVPP